MMMCKRGSYLFFLKIGKAGWTGEVGTEELWMSHHEAGVARYHIIITWRDSSYACICGYTTTDQPLVGVYVFFFFFSFLRVRRGVIISYSRAEELISQILIHIMQKFGA